MTRDVHPGDKVAVICPAKTNLTLSVGLARAEWGGRHALDTLYCGLPLADTLVITVTTPGPEWDGTGLLVTVVDCRDPQGDHPRRHLRAGTEEYESNHVVRAARALTERLGIVPRFHITLHKRIPVAAGLGGGSADAAGVLRGLDALLGLGVWPVKTVSRDGLMDIVTAGNLNVSHTGVSRETTSGVSHLAAPLTRADMYEIAASLGADMPFCLEAGLTHGTGYGERITPLGEESEQWRAWAPRLTHVLVGTYDDGLSTPAVYRRFDEIGAGEGDANMLQKAACDLHPRSGRAIRAAESHGATAFVSGSGPTVVALCPDHKTCKRVRRAWGKSGTVDHVVALNPLAPCPTRTFVAFSPSL